MRLHVDAAAQQLRSITLNRCKDCEARLALHLPICPACGSLEVESVAASGRGILRSFSRVERAFSPEGPRPPYTVVLVGLDEGPSVLGLLGSGDLHPQIGMRVVLDESRSIPNEGPFFAIEDAARGLE